jgi:hypothetical protein
MKPTRRVPFMRLQTLLAAVACGLAIPCPALAAEHALQVPLAQAGAAFVAALIVGVDAGRRLSRRGRSPHRVIVDQLGPRFAAGLLTLDGVVVQAGGLPWVPSVSRAAALVGRRLWEVEMFSADPQARQRLQAAIARAAAGELVCCDIETQSASGGRQILECCLRPHRDDDGAVRQLVISAFDVSERKAAETALATQLRAHELRFDGTPLAAIEWDPTCASGTGRAAPRKSSAGRVTKRSATAPPSWAWCRFTTGSKASRARRR